MSKVEFKLNLKGLNELMKSGEMQSILTDAANKIASAAGEGYEVEEAHPLSFAGISSVRANTYDSYYDALENKTLENAAWSVKI